MGVLKLKSKSSIKGGIEIDWVLSILLFFTVIMFSFFYISNLLQSYPHTTNLESEWARVKDAIFMNNSVKEYNVDTACTLPYLIYEPENMIAYSRGCDNVLLEYGNQSHYYSFHLFNIPNSTCLISIPSSLYPSYLPTYTADIAVSTNELSNSYVRLIYNSTCINQIYLSTASFLHSPICFNDLYESKKLEYGGVLNYDNSTFVFLPSYSKTIIFVSNTTRDWTFLLDTNYTHYYDTLTTSSIPSTNLFYTSPSPPPPLFSLYNSSKSITFYPSKRVEAYNETIYLKVVIKDTRQVYVYLGEGYDAMHYSCISQSTNFSYGRSINIISESAIKSSVGDKYNLTVPDINKSYGSPLPSIGDVYSKDIYINVLMDNASIYKTRGVLRVWK